MVTQLVAISACHVVLPRLGGGITESNMKRWGKEVHGKLDL